MSTGSKRKLPKFNHKSKVVPLSDSEDECSSNSPSNSDTETDTSIEDYQEKRSKEKNKKEGKKTTKKTGKEEKNEVEKISKGKGKEKKRSRNEGKEHDNYNDFDDISIDMTADSVSKKRIKLSYNLLVQCKMVDVNEKGKKFSYPALIFERKTKDGKNFEFCIPFNLSNRLIKALNVMLDDVACIKNGINEKKIIRS